MMTAKSAFALLLLTPLPGAAAQTPVLVMTPLRGEKAYQIAGESFATLWEQTTGRKPDLVTYINTYDRNLPPGDIVLIGSDAVHPIVHDLVRRRVVPSLGIVYGGDGYRILSVPDKDRTLLIVAGGSGRSTIYAVYDFFRRQAGAEYFWDGDRIPRRDNIPLKGVDIAEKPHFEYRGLRYFAHRGLHRFQAEHWDLADWKKEIDWLLKKRFNLFMLRTGIDDLFQRAFPGQVEYPPLEGRDPDGEARSCYDRTSFWPLRHRGELRKQVLRYAFDRGLLHPEDTGTITHWYSHTPSSFYRSHPDFPVTTDQTSGYKLPSQAIWDIEYEGTWDTYWKLTEAHIREYGMAPRLFHTIGMAERRFGASPEEDLQRKLYVYRKTQQIIRERYPDVPLLIAGWDFYGWWKNEDVQRLLEEFDRRRTIFMDYTADNPSRVTYKDWGLYRKFPWIFGIFHGFANNSDSHGDYKLVDSRVMEAASDPFCNGLVMWSEISHNDTFMLEYLAENSWRPVPFDTAAACALYCRKRYPAGLAPAMEKLWPIFLEVSQSLQWVNWSAAGTSFAEPHIRLFTHPALTYLDDKRLPQLEEEWKRMRPALNRAPALLDSLSGLVASGYQDEHWRRDVLDIARTTASRALLVGMMGSALELERWRAGTTPADRIRMLPAITIGLTNDWADVLGASDEFSMGASLKRLERATAIGGVKPAINPHSEQTLKNNSEYFYTRSHHYELVRYLYTPELKAYWDFALKKVESGDRSRWNRPKQYMQMGEVLRDRFYATPLAQMAPPGSSDPAALARTLKGLSRRVAELLSAL